MLLPTIPTIGVRPHFPDDPDPKPDPPTAVGAIRDVAVGVPQTHVTYCPEEGSNDECTPNIGVVLAPIPADEDNWAAYADPGPVPEQTPLVVLLHGRGASPQHMTFVAEAFAAACFRVVGPRWDVAESVADRCGRHTGIPAFNNCLERRRDRLYTDWILPAIHDVVFDRGWQDQYWDSLHRAPRFDKIIWAGHSAGAAQAAFLLRTLGGAGAIFISGGGELGEPEIDLQAPLADWMTQLPPSGRHVGLYHVGEEIEHDGQTYQIADHITGAMARNGVPDVTANAVSVHSYRRAYGTSAGLASLLVDDFAWPNGDGRLAHGGTVREDLKKAHMYLACKAAGRVFR